MRLWGDEPGRSEFDALRTAAWVAVVLVGLACGVFGYALGLGARSTRVEAERAAFYRTQWLRAQIETEHAAELLWSTNAALEEALAELPQGWQAEP